jgi:hypothetical protein
MKKGENYRKSGFGDCLVFNPSIDYFAASLRFPILQAGHAHFA